MFVSLLKCLTLHNTKTISSSDKLWSYFYSLPIMTLFSKVHTLRPLDSKTRAILRPSSISPNSSAYSNLAPH